MRHYWINFWQSLIENKDTLCNIEEFVLNVPCVKKIESELFENEIIPIICEGIIQKKLKKIELSQLIF